MLLYFDDIIVIAPDFKAHMDCLEEVLRRLQAAGLKLNLMKCKLLQKELKYLGHIMSPSVVTTNPEKVAVV